MTDKYVLRGLSESGDEYFYTGRAGSKFVSPSLADAFIYDSIEGARRKGTILNRMTAMHGIRFVAFKHPRAGVSRAEWTKNPKRRRFMKPKLRRVFVEDDGHVFAKQDGTGYIGRIKNPVRPLKRDRATARGLVKRYGSKARARKVAGGMIGTARSPAQREKFVAVRKALNPKRRKKNPNPPFLIEAKAKHWDAWRPYAGAWTKERAAQVANALGKQGLYARVMK